MKNKDCCYSFLLTIKLHHVKNALIMKIKMIDFLFSVSIVDVAIIENVCTFYILENSNSKNPHNTNRPKTAFEEMPTIP